MKRCLLVVKVVIGILQVVGSDFYTFPAFLWERQVVSCFISLTIKADGGRTPDSQT